MNLTPLEKAKKEYCRAKAEVAVEESFVHPSPFLTPEIVTRKVVLEADKEICDLISKFKRGVEILMGVISTLSEEDQQSILAYLQQLFLNSPKESSINEGDSSISDEQIHLLHQFAEKLLKDGPIEDAASFLFVLTSLVPGWDQIWLEFGIAEQKQGHFNEALVLYSHCSSLNTAHPAPHLYIAECYAEHGYLEEAKASLDWAIALIEADENFVCFKPSIQIIRKKIVSSGANLIYMRR